MDVLEEEVNKLKAEKAAIEASNEELKRQNKYWEELFAKQQLQGIPLTPQAQTITKFSSVPESQEKTQSSHEQSNNFEESDPSYENLEMTRGEFLKRQKLSTDNEYYGNHKG